MNLTKCSNGHFYDADRYENCPHCNISVVDQTVTMPGTMSGGSQMDVDVTKPDINSMKNLGEVLNSTSTNQTPAIDDDQKTIGIFSTNQVNASEPVVGWLVCVEGNHYGEDFRLITGRNFVGRSSAMEVCLSGDTSISRDKHLIIVFEPKQNTYIVQPGDSKELSYLNDEVILQSKEMKAYDILSMGNSKFIFVPFCSKEINWSLYENKE